MTREVVESRAEAHLEQLERLARTCDGRRLLARLAYDLDLPVPKVDLEVSMGRAVRGLKGETR